MSVCVEEDQKANAEYQSRECLQRRGKLVQRPRLPRAKAKKRAKLFWLWKRCYRTIWVWILLSQTQAIIVENQCLRWNFVLLFFLLFNISLYNYYIEVGFSNLILNKVFNVMVIGFRRDIEYVFDFNI